MPTRLGERTVLKWSIQLGGALAQRVYVHQLLRPHPDGHG
jgi:hypothetical protein